MICLFCPLVLFCLLLVKSKAQDLYNKHPTLLGIHFILNDFHNNKLLGKGRTMDAGLQITYLQNISKMFDYSVNGAISFPDSIFKNQPANSKSTMIQLDFSFRRRFIKLERKLQPYISAGAGLFYRKGVLGSYSLLGPGLQFKMGDIFLSSSIQFRYAISPKLNNHYFYSLGIASILGKPRKKNAIKPVLTIKVGISDRDNDGIIDSLDACPLMPGIVRFQGCPDRDNDGIEDRIDSCPIVFGLIKYNGCPIPDSDKDGINDEEDLCVNVPGVARYRGCPVPDTDSDGLNDEVDSCITEWGTRENNGCPLMVTEIIKALNLNAKDIRFKTGSYEILPSSFASLNEIAMILRTRPGLKLIVEGHTDNIGTEKTNQELSQQRANAVMKFLIRKGIAISRLKAIGYGELRPINSNSTEKGRTTNRRVSFVADLE